MNGLQQVTQVMQHAVSGLFLHSSGGKGLQSRHNTHRKAMTSSCSENSQRAAQNHVEVFYASIKEYGNARDRNFRPPRQAVASANPVSFGDWIIANGRV